MVGMTFGTLNRENTVGGVDVTGIDASVLVPVDVTALDDEALEARLRQIGRARNRLEGFLAQVVAEKKRRSRLGDTTDELLGRLRMSSRQATKTMRESDQLEKLPATQGALVDSRITMEHARIMGAAVDNGPLDEAKMLAAAEKETPEQFRKTMRDHQNELAGDDGEARHERQREAPHRQLHRAR